MFKKGQLARGNKSGSIFLVLSADVNGARVCVVAGRHQGERFRIMPRNRHNYSIIGNNYKAKE